MHAQVLQHKVPNIVNHPTYKQKPYNKTLKDKTEIHTQTMETQILEIILISAQGLKPPSSNLRRMQTYAVTWTNSNAKLRTRTDSLGGENPTWNDKFLFRVNDDFLSSDTSAVSVEIFAVGYIKDFLIGSVRFLLSSFLNKKTTTIGTPSFTAVQIRRPSGRFHGVLNMAAAAYGSSEFLPVLDEKVTAVSFRDIVAGKENRRLSRGGSRRSQQSSDDLSDGGDSTTSSSSSAASTALKEWNCVRQMAGKKKNEGGGKLDGGGGGLLCGLMMKQRGKIPFCPSDQNLGFWAKSFEGEEEDV